MIGSNLGNSFVGNRYFGGHWDFSFYPDNIVELKLVKYNKIVILHWKRAGGSRQQVSNVPLHTPHPQWQWKDLGEASYSVKWVIQQNIMSQWLVTSYEKRSSFNLVFLPISTYSSYILWRKGGRLINYRPSDTMMTIDINLFRSITS